MSAETFVIVGGGLAAARAVEAIREGGHQGPLILVGDETTLPYDRPPLSKAVLAGTEEPETALLHPTEWYRERNVDLWLGLRATQLRLEVAAAARAHGCEVTVVEPQPTPLHAVVGAQVGQYFVDLHTAHGVAFRLGTGVDRLVGDAVGADEAVSGVVTTTGEHLAAATVLVGVGITPNTQLAQAAGIEVDNGIRCDPSLRTSSPDVFAAGDVANWFNPTLQQHIRVDHWANARQSGFAAGRSMLGEQVDHDVMPYFFSDQYDAGLEYAGHVPRGTSTQVVLRGDPADDAFMAFWLAEGRVLAGMHVNVWDNIDDVQALIASRATVDPRVLADPREAIVTKGQKGIVASRPDPQPDPAS